MNSIQNQIQAKYLIKIKKLIEEDKFTINRKNRKNIEFMREYGLNYNNVKNIINNLSINDCFEGPEKDRDTRYNGLVFKFNPFYEGIKLYIKIRVDEIEGKSVCISIHEFGKYDEVK